MNSKLIVLALLTLLFSSSLASAMVLTAKAQTTTMTLTSSVTQISQSSVGSDLQVNITVANVADLWQWAANMTWDPAVFNLTQIKEGPFLKSATGSTMFTVPLIKDLHNGVLPDMVCTSTATDFSTATGSGLLATLTFKILTVQTSQIKFDHTELNKIDLSVGNTVPISHTQTDFQMTAVQATSTPSPTPTPTPTSSSTQTPAPTSTITSTPTPSTNPSDIFTPTPNQTNNPTTSPSTTTSPTFTGSVTANQPTSDLTTVYFILIAGAAMAVLVALALFFKKR